MKSGCVIGGLVPKLEDWAKEENYIEEGEYHRKLQLVFGLFDFGAEKDLKNAFFLLS